MINNNLYDDNDYYDNNDYDDDDNDNDNNNDDVTPSLSKETLLALRLFALDKGIDISGDNDNDNDVNIIEKVQKAFDITEREDVFSVHYDDDDGRCIDYSVNGVKRELGQTLASTGLTIWRAADHLCDFIFNNPKVFEGKTICELGAGLGIVIILLDKMKVSPLLVATDGDDDTITLLSNNVNNNNANVIVDNVYWGNHHHFIEKYPDGFDIVIAADVIYEKEQVLPLVQTVDDILKKNGQFILAFARRNVPIDLVLSAADDIGLVYSILDNDDTGTEPIYCFERKS